MGTLNNYLGGQNPLKKSFFHQKMHFFIIFLGPIWGSLIQYNHISFIISCADSNRHKFKHPIKPFIGIRDLGYTFENIVYTF